MKLFKLFAIFCLLAITGAFAEVSVGVNDRKLPTAWVWEVQGNSRTVYLVGELHMFQETKNADLDFKLGFDVFERASVVLAESNISSTAEKKGGTLSSKVGPDVWKRLENALHSALEPSSFSVEKKESLFKEGLKQIDNQSPDTAFISLLDLSAINYIRVIKRPPTYVDGLLKRLFKVDRLRTTGKKIVPIEGPTSSDDAWLSTCDTKQQSQEYIEIALSYFDFDKFWDTTKTEDLQQMFWSPQATSDDVFNAWLEIFPGSEIQLKCNVLPRHENWTPKILDVLKTKGEPVAVVVGFAHLAGPNGLLEVLKRNGYSRIKRVYSLSEP